MYNGRYCRHPAVVDGEHRGYVAPVHTGGVTQENGAAHGGVSYDQTCADCQAVRAVNRNGWEFEYGAWLSTRSYVIATRVCPICRTGHDRPHCDEHK